MTSAELEGLQTPTLNFSAQNQVNQGSPVSGIPLLSPFCTLAKRANDYEAICKQHQTKLRVISYDSGTRYDRNLQMKPLRKTNQIYSVLVF